jgi:hypothetical protein
LPQQLRAVVDQATYQVLLTSARTIAAAITNGRIVITVPDGTVVLDTARQDDPLMFWLKATRTSTSPARQ